ncbi:MAG: antitoxin [Clostridia bacterium]|nr:antitoxin [Clostridia bacterium]MBR0406734.1 antitoxin [Clostridia bacterium]
MRDHYDFSNAVHNPYAAQLKRQVTVSVDAETVDYFKQQAESTGIPVDRLINYYLADCVKNQRKLSWT